MARVFRLYGVDAREVMEIFCEDTKLNLSPTYLRPGFAFGGSCLPKDLRALQHLARMSGVDVPLLAGTTLTNELVVRDVVERVIASQHRRVCILGLSFKMDTDDLRESPNVELAERLIGKGFDVRIYDPIINPERLVGANLRHVEAKLPHLNRLLARTPEEALADAEVVVVASSDPGLLAALLAATEGDPRRAWSSTCTAGSATTSSSSPATRAWAGDRSHVRAPTRPHHHPEPARALRPAGVAGVPVARRRRLRRHRGLPAGQGLQALRGHRRRRGPHLPPVRPGRQRRSGSSSSTPTRSSPPPGWRSRPAGKGPFAVVQACNPPDIFWPLARWLRLRDGSRFVFDHHDLCPELYESRFPDGASLPHRGLLFLERMTFRTADRVTSTNESYAAVAVRRGRQASRARHRRAHRARPGQAHPGARGPGAAPRPRAPRGLPRRDGPAGRRRPGARRGRRDRPRDGARRTSPSR